MDIFVGESAAALARGQALNWFDGGSPARAWQLAVEHARRDSGRPSGALDASIWLSGSFCRPLVVDAGSGVGSQAEAVAVARTLCAERTGLAGDCAVWADTWFRGRNCVAVAANAVIVRMIQEQARTARFRVRRIAPWWSAVLAKALSVTPGLELLAVDDGDALTVLGGRHREFEHAASYPAVHGTDLVSLVRRARMTHAAAPAATLAVRGAGAARGRHEIDGDSDDMPVPFAARAKVMT